MSNEAEQQPQSLRALFYGAEARRKELESTYDSNSDAYQQKLSSAIATYEECLRVADRVSLFSPNETLEDVSSGDIQYMVINYHLAELLQRAVGTDRKSTLLSARESYEKFMKLLDSYDVLSKPDAKLYEKYQESPNSFSTASTTDAAARRDTKISRFRAEKELKAKLEQGVFRPDHSLPTMTIDEYLDEERKRGGIIEGGGEQSGMQPEPDEDNLEKADAETLKARAWDDYKDDNAKGSGNTMNRG
ncbi:putative tor signaling pathway regulator [Diplodia seriata]|uniref:Putative tor signaling pathway regulator n=1 Tax=Diplodia seriata TaxID=420778 RepID=A0A0G2GJR7_9PEZI|nr:putative tor signaling pathway regulator [Diplodia seriata]